MSRVAVGLLALAYLAFISLGLPDTVLGVAWPSVRATFGLSQAGLGLALATTICGTFASGLVAGRFVSMLGVGRLLAISTTLVVFGLTGYAMAPTWGLFVPGAALIGLGSGAIDSALNSYAASHFPARHLNWLHASWSIGATLGPLIMTMTLARNLSFRAGYAAIAAILVAMVMAFVATRRWWEQQRDNQPSPRSPDGPGRQPARDSTTQVARGTSAAATLRRGRTWLQMAIFFVYTGTEAGAGQWCFTVMRDGRGLSVEAAGLWTTAYWGSLLVGRVALGFVIDRVGADRLLRLAIAAATLGAAAFASGGGVLGQLGLIALGAGLAPLYPTLMSRTPARLGSAEAAHAVGFQVSAATLGSAAFPAAIGLGVTRAGPGVVPYAVLVLVVLLMALHESLLRSTDASAGS